MQTAPHPGHSSLPSPVMSFLGEKGLCITFPPSLHPLPVLEGTGGQRRVDCRQIAWELIRKGEIYEKGKHRMQKPNYLLHNLS